MLWNYTLLNIQIINWLKRSFNTTLNLPAGCPALLLRLCLLLQPTSLASSSLTSLFFMLVGVLLLDRFDGLEYCLGVLWLLLQLFKSSLSKVGEDTLDDGDGWYELLTSVFKDGCVSVINGLLGEVGKDADWMVSPLVWYTKFESVGNWFLLP